MIAYEIVLLTRPEDTKENAQTNLVKITDFINGNNLGDLSKQEYWGLKKLAYPIKDFVKAHYFFLSFSMNNASDLSKIKSLISKLPKVIRYNLMRVKSLDTDPSPIFEDGYESE